MGAKQKEIDPLARQPDETEAAWGAYLRYRDLPTPRRMRHLAMNGGVAYQNIRGWARKFKWKERVRIYDTQLDMVRRIAEQDALSQNVKEMLTRQARNAYAFGTIVMKLQQVTLERIVNDQSLLKNMDFSQLVDKVLQCARLLPALQQEERNAMGVNPTLNLVLNKDVGSMTDEELQQFIYSAESIISSGAS